MLEENNMASEAGGADGELTAPRAQRHKGCMDRPHYLLKVHVKVAYLKSVFVHPDNNTYPIFSIVVKETGVDYWKKCDHDRIHLQVQNLQVFDNTHYPNTLDPKI